MRQYVERIPKNDSQREVAMNCRTAVVVIISVLLTSTINIHSVDAADGRTINNWLVDKMLFGKRSHKIDLQCFFEGGMFPVRFEGAYTKTSEYIDEGSGTSTVKITDKEKKVMPPPPDNVIFKRRRTEAKKYGKLYIYDHSETGRSIYQIDERLRSLVVYQQGPAKAPLPFTRIYSGTCYGIF